MSIDRIAALLAKAERTDIAAEAEAYLAKAQALATAASIDLALARERTDARERRAEPIMRTVVIGERGKRANRHLVSLFIAVAHANDVRVDIASDSTYVIAYGMPSDLDTVETLFGSLAVQLATAAQQWLALGVWKSETYVSVTRQGGLRRRQTKAHTAQTARVAFTRAFVERISERLQEVRRETIAQVVAESDDGAGTALVLRRKESEVGDFHRRESKARGTWGGYQGSVRADRGSSGPAGRRAATLARLSEQRALTGKREVRGS